MEETQGQEATTVDWKAAIPAELASEPVWQSVPDLPTLMKNYVDMSKYSVGAVRVPKEDAPAEEWQAFYGKLGRPEAPDKYEVSAPEGVTLDQDRLNALRQRAHQEGLTPKQFHAMIETWTSAQLAESQRLAQEAEATIGGLKNEWGGAFDRKLGMAKRALSSVFGEDVVGALSSSPLGNNPAFIKGLARLGEQLAEHGQLPGGDSVGQTKEAALAEATALMADPAYRDKRNPNHAALVAKVARLFESAYN